MRRALFLSICSTAVLAHNSAADQGLVGNCHSPLSALSFGDDQKPLCGSHGALLDSITEGGDVISNPPWSRSAPCHRNGSEEYCIFSSSGFAENRGISILTTPERAARLANFPAFTQPELMKDVNQDLARTIPARYTVVPIPGKDMGVVANQPLQMGDRIMSNSASIMLDYGAFEAVPRKDLLGIQAAGVDYLPATHRARVLNLSTHSPTESYLEKIDRLLATNAFDISVLDNDSPQFFVVFPEIARFNHDCRPNADYYFDPDTLSQYIHALRPIAAGEEITVSYMNPVEPLETRLEKLQRVWGFPCGCSQCTKPAAMTRASDERIAQIYALRGDLQNYEGADSRATPQMAELFASLVRQERLDGMLYEAHMYAAVEHNGAGEPWLAQKHARLAIEHGLAAVGPKNADVLEMESLVADPWAHWSWMARTTKRMGWGNKEGTPE